MNYYFCIDLAYILEMKKNEFYNEFYGSLLQNSYYAWEWFSNVKTLIWAKWIFYVIYIYHMHMYVAIFIMIYLEI